MGFIVFNGVSSEDLHVVVEHLPEYEFPEKEYEMKSVPGRSGDILIDKKRWKNIDGSYKIAIDTREHDYRSVASQVASWLMSANGYCRLEDSYSPDIFRMACYKDGGAITNIMDQAGEIDIKFECKPQRWLKIGENSIIFTANGVITNPTAFEAKPKIVVHGSGKGAVTVNGRVVILNDIVDGTVIDCELLDVYKNNTNYNNKVLIDSFPVLRSGDNSVAISGGVTSVEIVPMWWTL